MSIEVRTLLIALAVVFGDCTHDPGSSQLATHEQSASRCPAHQEPGLPSCLAHEGTLHRRKLLPVHDACKATSQQDVHRADRLVALV